MKRKNRKIIAILIFLIVIAACGYFFVYKPFFRNKEEGRVRKAAPSADSAAGTKSKAATANAQAKGDSLQVSSRNNQKKNDEAAGLLKQAKTLQASGKQSEAQRTFEDIINKYPDTWARRQANFELGKIYLAQNDKYASRKAFSDALPGLDGQMRAEAISALNKLNEFLIFSPADSKDGIIYIVQSGDSLIKIARKYSTSAGFIKRINNLKTDALHIGQRLKIVSGTWEIFVYKSKFLLDVYLNGQFVKEYPVSTGMYDKTPEGEFVISVKQVNPTWYSPEGVIPYGDPRNLLGTRWLGFKEKGDITGYGIHGTIDESSIGKEASNGCIRMHNRDAEELYDMVPEGTKVFIKD